MQNNPQIGDFTHAPTADFSAKQQKRITTHENNITKLNNELIKTNENINDIKNNWFNIETSPLWKKVDNKDLYANEWYIIYWAYEFIDSTHGYNDAKKLTKINLGYAGNPLQKIIVIENIDVDVDKITLLFNFELQQFIVTSAKQKYKPIIFDI
ncbi:hypothetical protein [Spiroplasma ixodetis]|uniref:hypothetical protein n=1 Tax=Spiroplasma ixodetis TaxID=2141 RepID=UPI00257613B0|nr:hypothetical protein [Spiroplasma ixodetis]WJG69944.1 hypothetical protein SIXOD_v1c09380 [Spiroplasma ixodetis Y32]